MRITLQPAFVLHYRPYRETSLLVDLLTRDHGRIALISRGIRKNHSPLKALLQPFNSLFVSWQGKTELMTLTAAEPNGIHKPLNGSCLLSGLYINELLMRLLQKHDPCPNLYTIYQQTLVELQAPVLHQRILRLFEKKLLEELGYGLQLDHEIDTGIPLKEDKRYRYHAELGFKPDEHGDEASHLLFSGKSLIALAKEQLTDLECLREIKRLMRLVLTPLLGTQPLYSRKLFE